MARYRRRRRYYKKRATWSSNIRNIDSNQSIPPSSTFFNITVLCVNPSQNDNTVSQKYTVKNIEYTYSVETDYTNDSKLNLENIASYIMYVPEGMIVTETYPNSHPEYIMAYRYQGSIFDDSNSTVLPKIKTRLARTLNTGDKIICLTTGSNTIATKELPINIKGLVRWWTKAN